MTEDYTISTIDCEKYENHGNNYIWRGELGKGRNNTVEYVVKFQDPTETKYVRKILPYRIDPSPNEYFKREVSLLIQTQNLHLPFLKLIEFKFPSPNTEGYIITEYMKGGDLMSLIFNHYKKEHTPCRIFSGNSSVPLDYEIQASSSTSFEQIPIVFDNTRKLIIMYGLAVAIQFLHKRGIYHRDIKPENVLLDEKGDPYLSDFGYARMLIQSDSLLASGKKGTLYFMPQEVFLKDTVDNRADIYAFGVTVLLMLTGELLIPFGKTQKNAFLIQEEKLMDLITDGVQYIIPNDIPQCFKDLITSCCKLNPDDRIKIDVIVQNFENNKYTFSDVDQAEFQEYRDKINNNHQ